MIIIKYGNTKLNFYRHHDGYLAQGGYDLAVLFKHYNRAPKLITAMINRQRGIYIGDLDTPLYSIEPTQDMGEEYTYILDFETSNGKPWVRLDVLHRTFDEPPRSLWHSVGQCEPVADDFYKLCSDKNLEMEKKWINNNS
jgi:hypothetical protein